MGICCVGRYNGCYINIAEYVHTKYKNAVWTLLLMFECIVSMIIALYFKFMSKNWIYLQIFGFTVNAICILGCLAIPESPEYLYSFYKFRRTKKSIHYISKFNGKKMNRLYLFDTEKEMKAIRESISLSDTDESRTEEDS